MLESPKRRRGSWHDEEGFLKGSFCKLLRDFCTQTEGAGRFGTAALPKFVAQPTLAWQLSEVGFLTD